MSRCTGKTKAGKRCKANSRHDTGFCNAHSPKEAKESVGFGGPQPGAGRPPKPRLTDVLRERIEANIDAWLKPIEDGLTADRAIVVGDGPSARLEFAPDYPTRIKAHKEGVDRVYGRSTQPVRDDTFSVDDEIRELLAEHDRQDPGRRAVAHANGNGGAPH